eukprot:jgi/Chrzof1/8710/Cz03g21150.t1
MSAPRRSSREKKRVVYNETIMDKMVLATVDVKAYINKLLHGACASTPKVLKAGQVCSKSIRQHGFTEPIVLDPLDSTRATQEALGMWLMPHLDLHKLVERVGPDRSIDTVDVDTQEAGPVMTLQQVGG